MKLGNPGLNPASATAKCVTLDTSLRLPEPQVLRLDSLPSPRGPQAQPLLTAPPGAPSPLRLFRSAAATLTGLLFLPQAKPSVASGPLCWLRCCLQPSSPCFACDWFSSLIPSQFKCHALGEPLTDHSPHLPSSMAPPGSFSSQGL